MSTITQSTAPPASLLKPGESWHEIDDVPVFDEHEDEFGTHYDERLLGRIAENNNQRIADTGDWCPIVEHHTSDDHDPAKEPRIVGFAGPFWVDRFGTENPRPCVYTKYWIFPEEVETVRKNPRRSVEIWPEANAEDRYFDPIALQGATTPRRDLGLKYSKPNRPIRYEMAAAGGSNTFIPGTGNEIREPEKNRKDTAMKLSTDDLRQILEALNPELQAMVEATIGKVPAPTEVNPMDDMTAMADTLDAGQQEGLGSEIGGEAEYATAMYSKLGRYNKDGEWDMDGVERYMGAHDDSDLEGLGKYMKDIGGDCPTKQMYDKRFGVADVEPEEPEEDAGLVRQYRKQRDDFRRKYSKLQSDHATLKQRYSKLETEHQDAVKELKQSVRYSKLRDLQEQGFVLDVTDEMEDTADFTDQQFERHIDRIPLRYTKVPLNTELPADDGAARDPDAALKYQKQQQKRSEASANARRRVEESRSRGEKDLTYERALEEERQKLGV